MKIIHTASRSAHDVETPQIQIKTRNGQWLVVEESDGSLKLYPAPNHSAVVAVPNQTGSIVLRQEKDLREKKVIDLQQKLAEAGYQV